MNAALGRFSELVAPGRKIDLCTAALAFARIEYPELDERAVTAEFERIADAFVRRLGAAGADGEILAGWLATDQRFIGNTTDYYDPDNSFLNRVVERRTGIPITLTLVLMEVGRRIGYDIHGVGFPGHFLARVELPAAGYRYLDMFNGGARVTEQELEARLQVATGGRMELRASLLAAVTPRQFLTRMLQNLKAIYARGDAPRALAVIECLLALSPWSLDERRDRGMVLAFMGDHAAAIADLETYLEFAPDAPDADRVKERLLELRS